MSILSLLWPNALKPHPLPEASIRRSPRQVFIGILAFLPDWVLTVVLAAVFAAINKIDGFKREFSLTDTSLQHTYAVEERVPVWLLGVLVVGVPLVMFLIISLGFNRNVWDGHSAFLGLVLAQAITWVITEATKLCAGRPRPDVIDRCQPEDGAANAVLYGLTTVSVCTQTDKHILNDGFKSFPSGHSSSAFAGLVFLSLYLAGKFHTFESQAGHTGPAWLAMFPILGAALIAVSRTMDYRHHATDVLTGALIGSTVAWFCYHIYFFPLSHHTCHLPYSHRQWLAAAEDEEEDASRHSSSHLLANQGFSHSKHSHSAQSKVPSQPYPNNFAYQQEHQLHPMASHDSV